MYFKAHHGIFKKNWIAIFLHPKYEHILILPFFHFLSYIRQSKKRWFDLITTKNGTSLLQERLNKKSDLRRLLQYNNTTEGKKWNYINGLRPDIFKHILTGKQTLQRWQYPDCMWLKLWHCFLNLQTFVSWHIQNANINPEDLQI